jgi:hypothetical protein
MTTTSVRTVPATRAGRFASRPRLLPGLTVAAVAIAAAVAGATLLPNVADGTPMANMTHYMGLLAANQPWNLLLFMAVPVALAETVAVTELGLLFSPSLPRPWRLLNRYAGMVLGVYFLVVFGYLLAHAVVPLTTGGGWRGPADVIAVGAYLAGVVPLGGIAALELGLLGRNLDARGRQRLHALFVGVFLVVAHVAMIAGMLDPAVLGWDAPAAGPSMPGMSHG